MHAIPTNDHALLRPQSIFRLPAPPGGPTGHVLRESTHPPNGFHSLFNPLGSQTNKPKEYTQ